MITRFAPSPTGPLHLGHAYSALLAHDLALAANGTFLLRIEDIDQSRARPKWEAQIFNDLSWMGLSWPEPVMRQSARLPAYARALDKLWAQGLLFPCNCTRKDVFAAASAPQEGAPLIGPDGVIYPGKCRPAPDALPDGQRTTNQTLRLNMRRAARAVVYVESASGGNRPATTKETFVTDIGDVVLANFQQ